MGLVKKFRIKSHKKPNSIISFENISLSYGNRIILENINFQINEGEIYGMLGPNGVGKSTIFNLITGLIKPDSGRIKMNNIDVTNYPIYLRTKKIIINAKPSYPFTPFIFALFHLAHKLILLFLIKNVIYYSFLHLW